MKLDPNRELIFELRSYQQQVLALFRQKLEKGEKRIHVVAPPGSGKTVLGLAMLLETRQKGVVFAPNAAIQIQWAQRFEDATDVMYEKALDKLTFGTTTDAKNPYLSLTYQSATTKQRGTDELHENSRALLNRLVDEDYKVFIFDECHHLTGFWGRTLGDFLSSIEDAIVIGLTATPPIEATGRHMETYLDLIGDIDVQIPLPAIVKEGNLAPYQDLVYFTEPEEAEVDLLLEGQEEYRKLIDELEEMDLPRIGLSMWVQKALEDCRLSGKILPFDEWLRNHPDQAIAYVRYLRYCQRTIPDTVLWVDEMDGEFELADLVQILQDYIQHHLKTIEGGKEWVKRIEETLAKLGYKLAGRTFQAVNVGSARSLTLSKTKLAAMRTILATELERHLDDLRVLVLVDYEFGRKDQDGIDAVEVMASLTSDERTDELDPIMVTGKSVLVDDDLLPSFLGRAEKFKEKHSLKFELSHEQEAGYMRISGTGKDWNTRAYVRLISEMLEDGVTQTLVGTRALLGEGWDSIKLNTLIDLTVVAGYVSVNQIRGRTIRKDEDAPGKCANNWDVVTLYPGIQYGLYDFHRLERKHGQFYGISDDGVVEKGLGHVHALLSKGNASELSSHIDRINENMLNRSRDRDSARERWKIGEAYRATDITCLELRRPQGIEPVHRPRQAIERVDYMRVQLQERIEKRDEWLSYWFLFLPLFAALGEHLYRLWLCNDMKQALLPDESFSSTLRSFSEAVLLALTRKKLLKATYEPDAIEINSRDDGCYRLVLHGASAEDSQTFSEAVWELFGPVQSHKYIIERREYSCPLNDLTEEQILGDEEIPTQLVACHPVPSILGRRREFVDAFKKAWNDKVGPGETFYTRRGDGKELVKTWFRKRAIEVKRERKEVWE